METEVAQVCANNLPEIVAVIGTTVVTVAAALSNVVGKGTLLGKVVNWIGLNFTVEKKKK